MRVHRARSGRTPMPGVAPGVTERARVLVQSAYEAIASCENKMFGEMYAEALRRRVYENDPYLFNFMKSLEQAPVGIEEFLDSPEFLGATDIVLWPEVRKAVIEINKNWWKGPASAYSQALLLGATGSGKTEIAKTTTLYQLYLLSCVSTPQALYGLPQSTSIVFAIMAAKPHVTKKVIYMPLRKAVETIPYFQKHLRPDRLVESEMIFPSKNIRVTPGGSDADTILGEAIIGGIIDEVNFMNVVLKSKRAEVSTGRAGVYDQAQSIHSAMTRRKKGRFVYRGPQIGVICVSSSTRYKGDFTDKLKLQAIRDKDQTIYIYDKKQYEVRPQDGYCGEKFKVLVGNEVLNDTRILKPDEKVAEGALVLDVPIEYLPDFRTDLFGALRDVCGISTSSISPFYRRPFKIQEAIDRGREAGLESFLEKDNVVLGVDDMPRVKVGHYCQNPSRPRYVHIDLSMTGDNCVAEGQQVLLSDGRYLPIERIRVGESVVTHTGGHELVTRVFDNGYKRVLSVHTYGWPEPLRATDSHKVWAVRRSDISYSNGRLVKPSDSMFRGRQAKSAKQRYSYVPEFVDLGSLRPGDFLVTPRKQAQRVSNIYGVPLTYETGYLAGLFAAEGSFYSHHGSEYVQFSLHEGELAIRKNLEKYLDQYFGLSIRPCKNKHSKGITFRTKKSDDLTNFLLAAVGEYSHGKHLDCAHYGDAMFQAGVAHGYVDGDGHVRYGESGEAVAFKVKTVSRKMAESFYWLLVSNGFTPSMGVTEAYVDKQGLAHRMCYHVALSGRESMRSFASWTAEQVDIPGSCALALKDYLLTPITEISDGGKSRVYDLTVGTTHSYVVGNVAVHNCGIGMARYDGMVDVERANGIVEKLPKVTIELACSIKPDPNNEIQFAEIRAWVKRLKDVYGYPIKAVTYDGIFCVSGDTQVWSSRGLVPIRDIQVGDLVQSRKGPRPVQNIFTYTGADTLKVQTRHGYMLEMTGAHKIEALIRWDWSGAKNGRKPVWGWVRAEDLLIGQVVRIWEGNTEVDVSDYVRMKSAPIGYNYRKMITCPPILDEAVATVLGVLWGDGHIGKRHVMLTGMPDEVLDFVRLFDACFDFEGKLTIHKVKGSRASQVGVWCQQFVDWLRINGLEKPDVPDAIRRSPKSVQAAFISGLLATDAGIKDRDGQINFSTIHRGVAEYVQHALTMLFGIKAKLRVSNPMSTNYTYVLPVRDKMYHVQVGGSRAKLLEVLRLPYTGKQGRLEAHREVKGRSIYTKVSSVIKSKSDVYDLQVKGDHSYLANGFVSHNSTESIQAWRRMGMKTGHLSVDRTSVPCKQFRDALYDGRIDMYEQEVLQREMELLEYNEVTDKVDHLPSESKDVHDAVVGAYTSLLQRRASWQSAAMDDQFDEDSKRAELGDRFDVGDRR